MTTDNYPLKFKFTSNTATDTETINMTRGNVHQSKVHYQGKEEDYVIFVDDVKSVQDWKNDRSIPLAQVVSGFKIFVTHK